MTTKPSDQIQELSERFDLTFCKNLFEYPFVQEKVQILPYAFAKKHTVLPLKEEAGILFIAHANPLDLEVLEEVRCFSGKQIEEVLSHKQAIEEAIEHCYGHKENTASKLIETLLQKNPSTLNDEEGYDLLEQGESSPVIELLNAMLIEAIQQGASDIHFEPMENGLGVRYRIDGVLQMRHSPPREYLSQLITRIKVMAKLDIAEHRLPQDGRIKLKLGGRDIDFRVSTVPVVYGERIVLRILDKGNVLLGLNKLGMRPSILEELKKLIRLNEGIVLVTGPTGSGKTTTLYSALSEINSSETNIMTIEDPVEYKLQGMAQIGVNRKIHLSFATGLRHILRQDPDVIMIGEIRDKETAEIAIQSSLTGHLVLSTLHTNDAPSALTRLVDMGIEPYLLSSSVVGVLAQRLVRMNCTHCIEDYIPSDQEISELKISRDQLHDNRLYKSKGCPHCYGSGYKGRHGIYELMNVTSPIKRQLLQSADASQLQQIAMQKGMKSLREEGALLAIQGKTSSAEVLRVSRGCEEV